MRCPVCETEAAVMAAAEEIQGGTAVRVLEFCCRNRRCPDCGRTVGRQTVRHTMQTTPETAVMKHTGKEETA